MTLYGRQFGGRPEGAFGRGEDDGGGIEVLSVVGKNTSY
jgi:hypothetical protein